MPPVICNEQDRSGKLEIPAPMNVWTPFSIVYSFTPQPFNVFSKPSTEGCYSQEVKIHRSRSSEGTYGRVRRILCTQQAALLAGSQQ